MSKRAKGNILLIVFSVLMVFLAVRSTQKTGYTLHPTEHIVEISEKRAKEVLQKEDAVIYFGRDGCFWCAEAQPVLEEALEETGAKAYYVDTEAEEFQWASIRPYLEDYFVDEHVLLPLVVVCRDGEVINGHTGTLGGQKKGEDLTPEQELELKGIYTNMIEDLNKERTTK